MMRRWCATIRIRFVRTTIVACRYWEWRYKYYVTREIGMWMLMGWWHIIERNSGAVLCANGENGVHTQLFVFLFSSAIRWFFVKAVGVSYSVNANMLLCSVKQKSLTHTHTNAHTFSSIQSSYVFISYLASCEYVCVYVVVCRRLLDVRIWQTQYVLLNSKYV